MSRRRNNREEIELEIESIGFEGVAIARKDNIVHFVKGGVPGDKVRVQTLRKKKNFVETRLIEVTEPSPLRIKAPCVYFGNCGGCSWQNMDYPQQLAWKKRHVADAFERLGKVSYGEIFETMPSPRDFFYRNKMEFSFGAQRWLSQEEIASGEDVRRDFALGLHAPGFFDKVLDISYCLIQPEIGNKILNIVREAALRCGTTAMNEKTHEGFLRNLVLRSTRATNELMLILVTREPGTEGDQAFINWFREDFRAEVPEATTVIHAVNATRSPVAAGEIQWVQGSDFITEEVLGVRYRISPFSFFQTNSWQLEKFLEKILEYAELKEDQTVWDLYCGTGSITLPAARKVKRIYGLELNEGSVANARENAALNGIGNAEFFAADLHTKHLPDIFSQLPQPDTVIIDPPRAGMHPNIPTHLLEIAPPHIVYVSCNPATQARDCAILQEKYSVEKITPVDMFPQTYHVESVALLRRK